MKRSKLLSLLLSVLMIVSSISCLTVVSSAAVVDGGYEYDESNVITATYWELDDAGVLTIYMDTTPTWLDHAEEIKKVVLEAGVTTIPSGAFYGCTNLTSIDTTKADNDLITIGSSAFVGCYSLKAFSTSAWLDVIGAGAFQGSGVEVIDIAFVNELPDAAFYNCDSLKQVYIGGGLIEVGKNVFKGCDNLEYVWFGNGVYNIGNAMFEDCGKLAEIVFPDSLQTIGELAFDD
ncbi:MAG: leucine-rich repeat domain-containing protein, partial [Clostridia bacterium]|nr:leucine-rich repeat domain-containing protein [Clostridia bacterium]